MLLMKSRKANVAKVGRARVRIVSPKTREVKGAGEVWDPTYY